MKIKVLIIISLVLVFLTTGCSKVNNAKITINNNGTHSDSDINKVIKKLKSNFKYEFNACDGELLNIEYNSNYQDTDKEWNGTKYYDILKLNFEFVCKKNTETMLKNNTYGYSAIYGKKTKNSSWNKIDWGQG